MHHRCQIPIVRPWRAAAVCGVMLLGACATVGRGRVPAGWRLSPTGTTASLRGIAVAAPSVVYVGGSGGTLLRSDDGGVSFRDVAPRDAAGCDFRDLHAFDADRVLAMVAGQPARLYRTDDGGRSWQVVLTDPDPAAFFDAIAFDGERGVLFGDPQQGAFALWLSDDAGRSWRRAPADTLPPPADGEAGFAASGSCVVAADGGYLLVTAGATARCIRFAPGGQPRAGALPLVGGASSRGAFAVAARGERVVVVGGDYQAPAVRAGSGAVSADGGASFAPADALGYRSAVVWFDDMRLCAVGADGASWSADAGRTWQAFGERGFHALAVAADGTVHACGSNGTVARLEWQEER